MFAYLKGGGIQVAAKIGKGPMDIQGDMTAGISEDSVTPDRASEHEGGLQGAARFSVCAPGG